jgi:hypothetical protein
MDKISLTLPDGKKDEIKYITSLTGESINTFISRAINILLAHEKKYTAPQKRKPRLTPIE